MTEKTETINTCVRKKTDKQQQQEKFKARLKRSSGGNNAVRLKKRAKRLSKANVRKTIQRRAPSRSGGDLLFSKR